MHRYYLSCTAMAVQQQGLSEDREGEKLHTSATVGRYRSLWALCENCSVCNTGLGDNRGCGLINETVSLCNHDPRMQSNSNPTPYMNPKTWGSFTAVSERYTIDATATFNPQSAQEMKIWQWTHTVLGNFTRFALVKPSVVCKEMLHKLFFNKMFCLRHLFSFFFLKSDIL